MDATTDIPWNEVDSSNVARWRYDPDTKVLEIQFNGSDVTYSYDSVPQDAADGMQYAASIGQYFHQNIKNRYRYYRG